MSMYWFDIEVRIIFFDIPSSHTSYKAFSRCLLWTGGSTILLKVQQARNPSQIWWAALQLSYMPFHHGCTYWFDLEVWIAISNTSPTHLEWHLGYSFLAVTNQPKDFVPCWKLDRLGILVMRLTYMPSHNAHLYRFNIKVCTVISNWYG